MSAKNSSSPETIHKAFLRLEMQFPWIWALKSSWSFSEDHFLPTVKVVTDKVLSESVWRNKDWWVVYESRGVSRVVYEVMKLKSYGEVEEELRVLLDDKRFSTRLLYLVSRDNQGGSAEDQNFIIYKPESGKSDLGYLLQ
jgi:hypothetical protein